MASALISKPRPRARLFAKETSDPQPAPSDLLIRPEEKSSAELIPTLEYLSRRNPVLRELVQTLDLEETGPSYSIADIGSDPPGILPVPAEVEAQPDEPNAAAAINLKKLQVIAMKSLPTGNSYTLSEALDRIMRHTGVSEARAAKGLQLMVDNQIVERTSNGIYFLFDSTPF